jgi:holin-like protein
MLHFQRMDDEWRPIVVALVASTLLAIAVTALVMPDYA